MNKQAEKVRKIMQKEFNLQSEILWLDNLNRQLYAENVLEFLFVLIHFSFSHCQFLL